MTTIKGPIKIKNGFNAREFLEKHTKGVKIKLPFSATGWKSAKNSDLVEGTVAEPVKEEPKKKPKKKKFFK